MRRTRHRPQAESRRLNERLASSVLILAAFFTPWTPDHFGDQLGLRVVTWVGSRGVADLATGQTGTGLMYLGILMGYLGLLLYGAVSITLALTHPRQGLPTQALPAMLALGAAAWAGGFVLSGFEVGDFLWGYWGMGVAVLMASVVEWRASCPSNPGRR